MGVNRSSLKLTRPVVSRSTVTGRSLTGSMVNCWSCCSLTTATSVCWDTAGLVGCTSSGGVSRRCQATILTTPPSSRIAPSSTARPRRIRRGGVDMGGVVIARCSPCSTGCVASAIVPSTTGLHTCSRDHYRREYNSTKSYRAHRKERPISLGTNSYARLAQHRRLRLVRLGAFAYDHKAWHWLMCMIEGVKRSRAEMRPHAPGYAGARSVAKNASCYAQAAGLGHRTEEKGWSQRPQPGYSVASARSVPQHRTRKQGPVPR